MSATATITITVPAGKPGHWFYYKIEFKQADFAEVLRTVPGLKGPAQVIEIAAAGLWRIIE